MKNQPTCLCKHPALDHGEYGCNGKMCPCPFYRPDERQEAKTSQAQ